MATTHPSLSQTLTLSLMLTRPIPIPTTNANPYTHSHRNDNITVGAMKEALDEDLLSADIIAQINPYQPNLIPPLNPSLTTVSPHLPITMKTLL